ncbi:AAA family ATPase [Priestia megaterium]|uniref:Rad50/SbcC-type AAA domain-containing protein n=1 Tax=Priestia megaterium TaxID=1404 RepID=A0ABD4X072_PRIMG|nr:hypothetical protein [Priestia megaterium]MDD9785890.1 hypothetical protein [Priestia megaterium]MDH3141992.1 hypothetical protein [Priestia megaterium]
MLKLNALNIEVITAEKVFGTKISFSSKVNIINGQNSTGKSTCLNAILYGLGIEELLGGKKGKTMKPALRHEVEFNGQKFNVLESNVYLQIENENKNIITIKRSIKSNTRDANLITVIEGALLTSPEQHYSSRDMYVHLSGASNNELGFHKYLEKFIGWNLPKVSSYQGGDKKLYLQSLFPTFFIEQLRGWSDFLATVPTYYGIKNVSKKVIEYILDLDVIENERKRQEIEDYKKHVTAVWKENFNFITGLALEVKGEVKGITSNPTILTEEERERIFIEVERGGQFFPLPDLKDTLEAEYISLKLGKASIVGEVLEENQQELEDSIETLGLLEFENKQISEDYRLELRNLESLKEQIRMVEEDLIRNKDARKLKNLGSEMNLSLAKHTCPVCQQAIKDSLLPQSIEQNPMDIDENIKFLEAQRKMMKLSISANEEALAKKQEKMKYYRNQIDRLRSMIRGLRKEMLSDERLPSEVEIQKKIEIKNELDKLVSVEEQFNEKLTQIFLLSNQWIKILNKETKLPKEYFSLTDTEKLHALETYFKKNVMDFGYRSAAVEDIKISEDKYFPTVNSFDMKFDASASDHIRAIWAYTVALYETSREFKGNHPCLLVFDEPGQHQMEVKNIKSFFRKICNLKSDFQVIISTSLQEEQFKAVTKDIEFNLIEIKEKSIMPFEDIN